MPPLKCDLTGRETLTGYWISSTGHVYDRAIMDAHFEQKGTDPKSGTPLQKSDLVPIEVSLSIDSFAAAVNSLFGEIRRLRGSLADMDKELSDSRGSAHNTLQAAKLELIRRTYEARIENLQKDMNEETAKAREEAIRAKEETNRAREELSKAREEWNKSREESNKAIEESSKAKEEAYKLKKETDILKGEIRNLQDSLEKLKKDTEEKEIAHKAKLQKINLAVQLREKHWNSRMAELSADVPTNGPLHTPSAPPSRSQGESAQLSAAPATAPAPAQTIQPPPEISTQGAVPAPSHNSGSPSAPSFKRQRFEEDLTGPDLSSQGNNTDLKKREMMVNLVQNKRMESERRREADTPEALDTSNLSMDVDPNTSLSYSFEESEDLDESAVYKKFMKRVGQERCKFTGPNRPSPPKPLTKPPQIVAKNFEISCPENGNKLSLRKDAWHFDTEKGHETTPAMSGDGSPLVNGFISPTDKQAYLWNSSMIHSFNDYNIVFDNSEAGSILQVIPHDVGILIVLHEYALALLQYKTDRPFRTYPLPEKATCMALGPLPHQVLVGLQRKQKNLLTFNLEVPEGRAITQQLQIQPEPPKDVATFKWNRNESIVISDAGISHIPAKKASKPEWQHKNITGRKVVLDDTGTYVGIVSLNQVTAEVYRFADLQKTNNPRPAMQYTSKRRIDKIYWDNSQLIVVEKY